jgi:hypothetical protein
MQQIPGESSQQREERERKASETIPAELAHVSKLVLAPLAGSLGNKRLLIVADGALQYVPFHALPEADGTNQVLYSSMKLCTCHRFRLSQQSCLKREKENQQQTPSLFSLILSLK